MPSRMLGLPQQRWHVLLDHVQALHLRVQGAGHRIDALLQTNHPAPLLRRGLGQLVSRGCYGLLDWSVPKVWAAAAR